MGKGPNVARASAPNPGIAAEAAPTVTRWPCLAAVLALVAVLAACGSPEERAADYMKRAQTFYDQGDYVKAKLEAQNAAQIAPKDAEAHYLLALVAEQQQEFRPMVQHLLMAVDADPNLVAAHVKLGSLYFFGQAYDKAAEQAKAATALAPDDPGVHVLNARILLQKQDTEAGTKELDAALAKDPDYVDAILLKAAVTAVSDPSGGIKILDDAIARLGKDKAKALRQVRIALLAQQNRTGDVEEGFRELIRDYPKEEEFQYQLARFYASHGRVDDAERVMRSVVALDPNDLNARLGLAQFLAQMRSPQAAEKALEAFVTENPNQPELRAALGRLYEANNKPDAALAVYEELVKRDPKSKPGVAARVRIAALKIGKGKVAEGTKLIDAVLADEPDNADALLIRAGLRVRDKQFNDAIADVRTVLRKEPKNTRAMLLLARTHSLMNDRVLAKDAYRRLLAADPKNADAPRELAVLEAADKNYDAAEDVLRARLKAEPNDVETASRLVELLGSQKAWGEAEVEAKRIAAMPDDKGVGEVELARLALAQKKNAEAAESFRKALEKNPEATLALEGLVATLNQMGRQAEATRVLQDYLKKYPNNLSAKYLQGTVLARKGDTKEAEKIFEEIVGAKPDASVAWAALAGLNRDDPDKRIEEYKRGLAANPGNAQLGLLLGSEYERQKRFDEAIAHYQELLKANPNVDLAANNLAALLLDRRTDQASYAKALELAKGLESSTNPAVLDTVGWAYYRNKNYPSAVRYLERAVAGAGNVPLLRYHLGMAYLASNNPVSARQELQRAVTTSKEDFPGLEEAKTTLKRLSEEGSSQSESRG